MVLLQTYDISTPIVMNSTIKPTQDHFTKSLPDKINACISTDLMKIKDLFYEHGLNETL